MCLICIHFGCTKQCFYKERTPRASISGVSLAQTFSDMLFSMTALMLFSRNDRNPCITGTTDRLAGYGGKVHCYISDEDVASEAKSRGCTRATVCMERGAEVSKEAPVIFAIGNAPTALVRLAEMIETGELKPALIIGAPVGFVNVVESKEIIMDLDVPYIIPRGRKGGSNIAATICNAMIYYKG